MALTVCGGCRRHVRQGDDCPFCGTRTRTTLHLWKAAVLTAMVPLGLAACYGTPPTPDAADAGGGAPSKEEPAKDPTTPPEPVELDSAVPDPSGHDPADAPGDAAGEDPEQPVDTAPPEEPKPEEPKPEPPKPSDDNTKPDGTDTPIVEKPRPAKKYGAPPRPRPKYGGPPRPKPPVPDKPNK
jgi:hypothetical protein